MTTAPITTSDLTKHMQDDKLSLREKIGYGLGDAGGTVITCLIMTVTMDWQIIASGLFILALGLVIRLFLQRR